MMNNCNSCNSCNRCKRACARPYFNLFQDPYDPSYWDWEMNGEMGKVKVPKFNETDTKLSTNYSNATLNYSAERHLDTITGEQLGSIINLDDLRDVDATNPDACSILVFNPGCGLCPCSPDEEMWKKYTIPDATEELVPDDQGRVSVLAKTDCGCITEAFIPAQPDLDCIITNIMNAIAPFAGDGQFKDLESGQITPTGASTPGFGGWFNPNTGEFSVRWSDWEGTTYTEDKRLANGVVTGNITASKSFNYEDGSITYTITRIHYDSIRYDIIRTGTSPNPLTLTLWGGFPGVDLQRDKATLTAEGLRIFGPNSVYVHVGNSYTASINKTFTGTKTFTIPANGGIGAWFDLIRVFNDWVLADDDGVVQGRYRNPLNWNQC